MNTERHDQIVIEDLEAKIEQIEAQLASARAALEQYALRSNWNLNARFDPNAPWFDGISFAQSALEKKVTP